MIVRKRLRVKQKRAVVAKASSRFLSSRVPVKRAYRMYTAVLTRFNVWFEHLESLESGLVPLKSWDGITRCVSGIANHVCP